MSFVRMVATLAAGFAAAKGLENYRAMGGMPGVTEAIRSNPALKGLIDSAGAAGGQAQAGLGGLMAALGGAAAGGAAAMAGAADQITGTTAATDAMESQARLLIRAMIQAARADGEIDADERARIESHIEDATDEELAFVRAEMARPVDAAALARDVGAAMRAQVYGAAAAVTRYDSAGEQDFVDALGRALGLDAAMRQGIHAGLGIAAPRG
jgi:uncharacterized membrane protein YebE (DUF533 family)